MNLPPSEIVQMSDATNNPISNMSTNAVSHVAYDGMVTDWPMLEGTDKSFITSYIIAGVGIPGNILVIIVMIKFKEVRRKPVSAMFEAFQLGVVITLITF